MHKIKVHAKCAGSYDNVSPLRIPRKQIQNRSDGTNPDPSLSSNASKNHTSLTNNSSRRLNPIKDPSSKPRKPGLLLRNRKPQALKARQEQSMSNKQGHTVLEEPQKPLRPGLEQTLSGGDSPPPDGPLEGPDIEPEMLLQPDTRPISHEQLVVEVKGIYAGLVMVEAKCIDIDEKQSPANASTKMNLMNDQWHSLVALHKQLLHERHDFFLASQHPSASPDLSRLSAKYSMPARMWRHGIHALLDVLRYRLPESLEHMLAIFYMAYSMMALLYETVRMLRLGVHMNSASWRKFNTTSCSRIGQYAALVSNCLRRRRLSWNSYLVVPLTASWLPAVKGSPMGKPDNAGNSSIMTTSVHLLVGSLYVGFAAAALATAHSLATKKGPIRVWGSVMGVSAYGWWAVKNDETASSTLSIINLGVWAVSAFQYGNATFQEFRIPERLLLITLLGALMLVLAIVKFITPSGAPISQSDLLSLSLPAMSLSLAITANLFACFRSQPPSPATSQETEIEGSASGGDPNNGGSFQQRATVPGLDTSRFYLLGSPLHEDSTRIWETDD